MNTINKSRKILIDIEGKGAIGYYIKSDNKEKVDIILAGKEIIHVPENEQENKIYKLLEQNCDLFFCTNLSHLYRQLIQNYYLYYQQKKLKIVEQDKMGSHPLFDDKNYPVGYINRQGMYGIIAKNFQEFLELIVYYPYWQKIIACELAGESYDLMNFLILTMIQFG